MLLVYSECDFIFIINTRLHTQVVTCNCSHIQPKRVLIASLTADETCVTGDNPGKVSRSEAWLRYLLSPETSGEPRDLYKSLLPSLFFISNRGY